jgi:hypothetical protein
MNIFQELAKNRQRGSVRRPIKELSSFQEEFDDFSAWFDSFQNTVGYSHAKPWNTEEWFNSVQDGHSEIRRTMGGISTVMKHEIEEMQKPATKENCDDIIAKLADHIRLSDVGLSKQSLLVPYTPKGMKVSKAIAQHMSDYDLDSGTKKAVNALLEKLGQQWAKAKTVKGTLYSKIDTATAAFVLLGHYGVDHMSCFKVDGKNEEDKFVLAGQDNTFIFLASSKSDFGHYANQESILSRAWGFYDIREKTVNFCNIYVDKKFVLSNILEACREQSAKLLKEEVGDVKMAEDMIEIDAEVFHNNKAQNWTFYTGKKPDKQVL